MSDHHGGDAIAEALGEHLTVLTIDRRARGESGDSSPGIDGAVDRQVADLTALIDSVGGRATLLRASSGAVMSLAAAAHGLPVDRLVLFEPPFATAEYPPVAPPDMPEQLTALLAEGRDEDVVGRFLIHARAQRRRHLATAQGLRRRPGRHLLNAVHRTIGGGDHGFDVPTGAAAAREFLGVG